MKITDLKLFLVSCGHNRSWGPPGCSQNYVWVKVYTDEGIDGIGEAFHSLEDPIEGTLSKYKRWLIGQDPTRVLYNWQAIYRGLRYPLGTTELASLSTIEQCLWDIAEKSVACPSTRCWAGRCVTASAPIIAARGHRCPSWPGCRRRNRLSMRIHSGWPLLATY